MPDYTKVNIAEVQDAALARAFQAAPEGLEFIAVGAHHAGDGVPVDDPWVS